MASSRQQGRPLLALLVAAVEAALRSSSPPSLLPAGRGAEQLLRPEHRCFRDVQTMRHHAFASEQRYGTFGQVCLGVPPDFPVIAF